jgi:hypothetical protein
MQQAYEHRLEGAKQAGFNGCITYQDQTTAEEAKNELRPHIDRAYDLVAYQGAVSVEVDMEYCSEPRLRATDLLKAIIASNPITAEFDCEDEDGEQYQLKLVDNTWALLQCTGTYEEVV